HLLSRPYMVASRRSRKLIGRLAGAEGPVLFEGLHTCAHIDEPALGHRLRAVRMHNVEHDYYRQLTHQASGLRAMHFSRESRKLRRYEPWVLRAADVVLPISQSDHTYFAARHDHVHLLPPFHPFDDTVIRPGAGEYVLIQGDMRLPHNRQIVERAAPISTDLGMRLVVAGRAADRHADEFHRHSKNIEIHSDVSQEAMVALMRDAHVHVVDGQGTAGFKLKLLTALFTARHVVAHDSLLDEELHRVTSPFDSTETLRSQLQRLIGVPVDATEIQRRKAVLLPRFSNTANANKLLHYLEIGS
ncbi:MAG: hypothetical protein R3330_02170, partial [Saprospiraceae bacterium]|nr:hypothetical protein [Saprospiraceae bacterium]